MNIRPLIVIVSAFALAGCAGKKRAIWTYTPPPTVITIPTSEPVGRYGIGCRTVAEPDVIGPPSYSVQNVGKRGVPRLTAAQKATIRAILRYKNSPTIRFAFIGERFIVFDANGSPCSNAAAGYWIMNDPRGSNFYYQPGEYPGDIHVGLGDASPTQGPWMNLQGEH